MTSQGIPIVSLNIQSHEMTSNFSKPILENEINGVRVEHVAISGEQPNEE